MGTRLLAGLPLVAIAATACSGAPTRQAQAQPTPLAIDQLNMVSVTEGWARTASGDIARTTDGAHTWRTVQDCPADQLLPVGADELWSAGGADGDVRVCHTTDGGATWRTSTVHVDPDASITDLTAPDPHDVWIETEVQQGMHSDALIGLYRSTDTGKTWQEVASAGDIDGDPTPGPSGLAPSCGRDVAFATATTGWSVGGCAQGDGSAPGDPIPQHFQISTDGGRHWSVQPFSPTTQAAYTSLCDRTDDCVFGDPTFAGADGVVTCRADNTIALFTTDDAGRIWDVRDAPPAPQDDLPSFEVVSPNVVLVSITGTTPALTETSDAGRTWTNVPLPPSIDADRPDFVSADVGFLSGNSTIEATTDAGRSWRRISPVVVK